MAVELTDEEKAKLDAHLKELGYDGHAKDVIKRANEQAKKEREAREAAEAEAKRLKEAEEQRQADEKKRAEEAEAERKRLEDEKKSAAEQVKAAEDRIVKRIEEEKKAAAAERERIEKELADRDAKIAARDKRVLEMAVKAAARERGILDAELVSLIDTSKVTVTDGVVDEEAIAALVEEHAKAKPHLYRETTERERDSQGRFIPAGMARPTGTNGKNWAQASDDEFTREEQRLRSSRV